MTKFKFKNGERVLRMYDVKSIGAFSDAITAKRAEYKKRFLDAANGLVLERTLTAVDPRILEKKYPQNTFLNLGVDVDNSGGDAEIIQSLRTKPSGGYAQAADATTAKGIISLAGDDNSVRVFEREAESNWSDTEVKQASMQGISLVDKLVGAHSEIYQREIDECALTGKTGGPSTGLLNSAAFASSSASDTIQNLTGQDAYDEMVSLITDQFNGVNNTPEYMADTVIMPVDVLNLLQKKILNSAAGAMSVLAALKLNFPSVEFYSSARANSVSGSSRTVAFNRGPDCMKLRIPHPFELGEIIRTGSFKFKFDTKYRIAGLDILESTAGRILTGL